MEYLIYPAIILGCAAIVLAVLLIIRAFLQRVVDKRVSTYQNDLVTQALR